MDDTQIKILADSLWSYFLDRYLKQYLSDSVCYYMATVTAAPQGGMIEVQRPFDNPITLPCAWSAATLDVGDAALVLVFGDISNSVVIGTTGLGAKGIRYSYAFTTADWTAPPSGSTLYSLTLSETTHDCGTDFIADVLTQNGTSYEKQQGYPSSGWKLSIDANGNITLTTETAFNGKLVIR